MILALAAAWGYEHSQEVSNFYHRKVSDGYTIRSYFAANPVKKLQLGAGSNNAPGWLNSDINPSDSKAIYLDVTAEYPFSDGTFHYIFSEHVIEHIPWEGGLKMLKESYRVLAPGGKVRIVTPNLTKLIYALHNENSPEVQKFIDTNLKLFKWPDTPVRAAYIFNKSIDDGHIFMYDPATLRKTLELAGFTSIRELSLHDKTDEVFEAVEYRTRENFGEEVWFTNSWGSMAFEATK
jgi:SAM-dependent methyltransferase